MPWSDSWSHVLSQLISNIKTLEQAQNLIYSILLSHTLHLFANDKLCQ